MFVARCRINFCNPQKWRILSDFCLKTAQNRGAFSAHCPFKSNKRIMLVIMAFGYICSLVAANFALSKSLRRLASMLRCRSSSRKNCFLRGQSGAVIGRMHREKTSCRILKIIAGNKKSQRVFIFATVIFIFV